MFTKIPAVIAAALLLGSSSIASAAVKHTNARVTQFDAPVVGSYGGYSADPQWRALEQLADKYNGWAEYIQ